MATGLPARVRSHRAGGAKRRGHPVRVFAIVAVLVAALLTAGFSYYKRHSCTGKDTATIAASPDITSILEQLATDWQAGHPSVDGTCVAVNVEARDSALMATELASPWDPQDNGPAPDVWVPESSVWVREASVSSDIARMIPDRQPSLARTPAVIAMPRDMATALGWPAKVRFDWPDLARASQDSGYWPQHGQAWGPFTFAMTDPKTSTAGLLALMAIADGNNDGNVDSEEQAGVLALKETMGTRYLNDTSDIISKVEAADATGRTAVINYLSAFPALERDVIAYNHTGPKEPLVAIYPTSGSYDADYPYLILQNPPWKNAGGPVAAAAFLSYARGAHARDVFLADGYRDANRIGGAEVTVNANGAEPRVSFLPRAVLAPDSVAQTLTTWTAVTRPTNMLLVLDVSGSMNEKVSGRKTRLDLAKAAAIAAVNRFDDQSSVGLWIFSTAQNGTRDYKELVPLGKLSDSMNDGHSRQHDMVDAIGALQATGDTGLYDTIAAAQADVVAHFQPYATNLVVLMTDGRNDDTTGGLTLDQLKAKLKAAKNSQKNVPVVTVGIGSDADFATLADISHTSGTISLGAQEDFDIDQVLLAAIFGTPQA